MTDQSNESSQQDLGDLDPEQFVGEPPSGDDSPGEFVSSNQSPSDSTQDDQRDPEEDQ